MYSTYNANTNSYSLILCLHIEYVVVRWAAQYFSVIIKILHVRAVATKWNLNIRVVVRMGC